MRNSLEFVVDSMLDLFTNPTTGYIVRKEGSLPYANPSSATDTIHKSASNATINSEETQGENPVETAKSEETQGDQSPEANDQKDPQTEVTKFEPTSTAAASIGSGYGLFWYALSVYNDTVPLTADKVMAIKHFIIQVQQEMLEPLPVARMFISANEDAAKAILIETIKKSELQKLQTRIDLLSGYLKDAELRIKASRHYVNKAPAEADSLLETWKQMLSWLRTDETLDLLHMVLTYESNVSVQKRDEIQKTFEDLEGKFVSDLFRLAFQVKMDELRHNGREYTSYVRMVPADVAEELLEVLPTNINSLNAYAKKLPGQVPRINQLIQSIAALQQVAAKCYNEIENKRRYSLLPDRVASFLPARTPSLVVSTHNQFLANMKDALEEYHKNAKALKSAQERYKNESGFKEKRKLASTVALQ